jgi:enoyl-CoA hydratase/carnithine racemase
MAMDFGGGEEIRFERKGRAGVVTMTRPQALNAITHRMINALSRALDAWETDPSIDLVLLTGEGRAFSAGGDIMAVYEGGKAGRPPVEFFADEYRLNARVPRFSKPYVSLIDGIVMGGGVGLSFHGSHRVLTENAQFAMPEVGIGFFPDVGGSHLLPGLEGSFGVYLALTGERIRYGDALWSGLATHAVKAADQAAIIRHLTETGDVDAALSSYTVRTAAETTQPVLEAIRRHFSKGSLAEIIASLEAVGDEFASRTLATLAQRSPTSLNVAFRQISAGRFLSMDDCMRMEFRILVRMLQGHDFYEGIRAAIVDKDRQPKWRPEGLGAVTPGDVEPYFASLGEQELAL